MHLAFKYAKAKMATNASPITTNVNGQRKRGKQPRARVPRTSASTSYEVGGCALSYVMQMTYLLTFVPEIDFLIYRSFLTN